MNLYYTSGRCASYIRHAPFARTMNIEAVYIPQELVTHEIMGMYILTNPSWELCIVKDGDKLPHTCYMVLESSSDVDRYK